MKNNQLKEQFLLRDDVVFLNHGSFGACTKPVFKKYQQWQMLLESQPVEFFNEIYPKEVQIVREQLSQYLNSDSASIACIPNSTYGINLISRSMKLFEGDEILASDHEYGACNRAWKFICDKSGSVYKEQKISLPVESKDKIVNQFLSAINEKTKIIFLSHITSQTALIMPVKEICKKAREKGILTVIDGSHAIGQIRVDLKDINPDFYVGNCHKWLCSPKGAGFIYAKENIRDFLEPLIVSWGWKTEANQGLPSTGINFIDYCTWMGTDDPSAYLSVPEAIKFQEDNDWDKVRFKCHEMACDFIHELMKLKGVELLYPISKDFFFQMFSLKIPVANPYELKKKLYDQYKIEILLQRRDNVSLLRTSVQGYNSYEDLLKLKTGIQSLLD